MFIVIEGPDGSGKTTLAKQLTTQLKQLNKPTVYTYEPTFSKFRNMMQTGSIDNNIYEFADLFVEDRKYHIETLIAPALAKGENIVCDRYKYSAMVYQQLQGVDITYLQKIGQQCLIPDIVYVLIPTNVDLLLERIVKRGKKQDIFENIDFLQNTIELYKRMQEYFPKERIVFLDASIRTQDNIGRIMEDLAQM